MVVKGGGFEISKRFDVFGLAETFLQKDEEVSITGYGRNREGGRRVVVVWEC